MDSKQGRGQQGGGLGLAMQSVISNLNDPSSWKGPLIGLAEAWSRFLTPAHHFTPADCKSNVCRLGICSLVWRMLIFNINNGDYCDLLLLGSLSAPEDDQTGNEIISSTLL